VLCTWHACAKLRLHTTTTVNYLKEATRALGFILRKFTKKTSSAFDTRELPNEINARTRRQKAGSTTKGNGSGGGKKKGAGDSGKGKGRKQSSSTLHKMFNLYTYKLYALGGYVNTILLYGTTDGYSTQTVHGVPLFFFSFD
jgi:hypothetical protein